MAVFIPDVKPEDFNNSPGEKEVYEALKLLGKDYTVFYSLRSREKVSYFCAITAF